MKHIFIDKYIDYSIEDFINLIVKENLDKQDFINTIENKKIDKHLMTKIIQKINFAYDRIKTPLDNDIRLLLIIFPFGIINKFNKEPFFDIEHSRKLGFIKKIEEYKKYSSIGLIFYTVLFISAVIFF